jgi:uncharacterized protein (DUF2267 family)
MAEIFQRTLQQTHEWLHELMRELGWKDEEKARHALRAVLHALRDRLTVAEAVQVGAQFPALIRGYYYEGWRPSDTPLKERRLGEFLQHVKDSFPPGELVDSQEVVEAVFRLLTRRVSAGEVEDIKSVLPRAIRGLWPREDSK